jgi:hypothetical protein
MGAVSTSVSAKDSLYQMLTKMENCLRITKITRSPSDDYAWAEWNVFRDNAKFSLEKFIDVHKYPAHSFDAQIDLYKADLIRCNRLLHNTFFAPIKATLQFLSQELHALITLIEPYRGISNWTKIFAIGAKISKFDYLLPQEMRKNFLPALKRRIQMNCQ